MNRLFETRAQRTDETLARFESALRTHLGADLAGAVGDHTTVYVTGSGGRGEMSEASDLDLFLVRERGKPSGLDAALLQSAIIRATRECALPEPSGDGVFLEMHSADDFEQMLGSRDDDAKNKFTARMLLLLESRPVLGEEAYERIVARMVDRYWLSGEGRDAFLPYMFVNDVVRYWRVVLLNHESRLLAKERELREEQRLDDAALRHRLRVERYVRSYKLRFARCLTVFASLAYLLGKTAREPRNVSKDDMRAMVKLTPLARLTASVAMAERDGARAKLDELQTLYAEFLEQSAFDKKALSARFDDLAFASAQTKKGSQFADAMFDLLQLLGQGNPLYRHMLV